MSFNFQDIFKSGFLENAAAITIFDMVLAVILSFAVGLFIFFVYKKCYAGIMYSQSFGITLIALCMITALLILAVTVSTALWSVLRTRDGTREAYADTQAADIVGAINNAEPWGSVSSVTVGNGAGDNGVVVTVGSSDAAD